MVPLALIVSARPRFTSTNSSLVLNVGIAKALGLAVADRVIAIAVRVIE